MNRINDKGDYHFVLRSHFVSLFHFLWFKFKRFIQEVFCENGTLKFPKKTNVDLEKCFEGAHFTVVFNIIKEELLHRNFKGLYLLIYNTTSFFLKRHFKNWWHWGAFTINGWNWGEKKWYFHFKSVKLYRFLNFCFFRCLLYLW